MSTNARTALADIIRPIAPQRWDVTDHTVKSVSQLRKTTVFIDFTTIVPLAEAPLGNLTNTFEVAIVSHREDYEKAEDQLDADVLEFTRALDESSQVSWEKAEKRGIANYLGWVVTVQMIAPKPQPQPED